MACRPEADKVGRRDQAPNTERSSKRNEPAFVAEVVQALAGIRDASVADLAGQVSRNFDALFGSLAEATD